MSRIFLSYRRDDSAGFAGRLADALETALGAGCVFRDVDDIRPGDDFQQTIHGQLQSVDAVLVMIGPRWLEARTAEGRRLDDPGDFVRMEIVAALGSGKPVIPLLVGGAAMPAEADLPGDLAGLARRQAVTLSDSGWRGDLARLVASLRELAPEKDESGSVRGFKHGRLLLAGLALLVVLGLVAVPRFFPDEAGLETTARPAPDIVGRWTARVKYGWGDQHDEVFEFKNLGGNLHGTASYLTGRLTIEQAKLEGEWLRFITRSQEMLGSDQPWKEVTHRYTGQVTPEGIRFTLETGGGYTIHAPVEFVARRVVAKPAP